MATRMQQRRGTAAQWTAANPILAAGEIGFETDTSKFKMGNGSSAWSALQYFANAAELAAIVDGAPDLLNTLNELAAALGDDPAFFTNMAESIADSIDLHNGTTNVHGIANTALLATTANVATAQTAAETFAGNAVTTHNADISDVHGIANTADLATKNYADSAVGTHQADSTEVHGIADTSALATKTYADTAVQTHENDVENIHGIANTADLATKTYADTAVSTHSDDTLGVHGITDTSALATKTYADTAVSTHQADTTDVHGISNTANLVYVADLTDHNSDTLDVHGISNTGNLAYLSDITTHNNDTLDVHGIANTALLATQSYVDTAVSNSAVDQSALAGVGIDWNSATDAFDIDSTVATTSHVSTEIGTHNSDTTSVHGIADTADLATKVYADAAVTTHTADTTAVHGIADTSALALTATVNTALDLKAPLASPTFTGTVSGITKTMVGLGSVDNTSDSAKPVSTAAQTALDLKANLDGPTFTGTVSGITKSMVGLGSVDNTTDAGKPVSTATQTALDLKANLASPTLTGTPLAPTAATGTNTTQVATTGFVQQELSILTTGAPALLNTLDELAAALGDDANYASTVTTALSTKAPLANPTFTGTVSGITKSMVGLGSVDNTADASKPVSTAQQTALDLKSNLASPTFTGTVTAPAITATALITASASGVAFTDGTQTKEGVASRTPILQKTAAYTLSALTERDSLIEVSSATGVTITIPTNTAVAYPIGTSIDILQTGAGQVTIAPVDGTVTVNATPGLKLRTTWSSATLFKRAANTWVVFGDLTA